MVLRTLATRIYGLWVGKIILEGKASKGKFVAEGKEENNKKQKVKVATDP